MAKQTKINLLEFQNRFNSEEARQQHLFKMRWPERFRCPRCDHDRYYEIKTRHPFECTQCHYQTSVIARTVMEKTRTSLAIWFWAIHLVANDKRGRGTDKTPVLIGLSLGQYGNPLYVKMRKVSDVKKDTLVDFAHTYIETGSKISSDAFRSYKQLAAEGYEHEAKEFNPKENPDHLKWLHTIVSNAKAFIAGTFHGLDAKHLQAYLNEFCYRFNRRNFKGELFNRL